MVCSRSFPEPSLPLMRIQAASSCSPGCAWRSSSPRKLMASFPAAQRRRILSFVATSPSQGMQCFPSMLGSCRSPKNFAIDELVVACLSAAASKSSEMNSSFTIFSSTAFGVLSPMALCFSMRKRQSSGCAKFQTSRIAKVSNRSLSAGRR